MPVYVHRAEDFIRALHGADSADIAAAVGGSVRTLGDVFPRFRGRTPLEALHACRLEQIHAKLCRSAPDTPIGAVARRYGLTNASHSVTAFSRRFGETPLDVVRRVSTP